MAKPIISIIMGSDSDYTIMKEACDVIESFNIAYEVDVVSAHRTPEKLIDYATKASNRGIQVIIAGAGGAAHLPGMVASMSSLPVIGVPIKSSNSIDGWDSVLSILQMPGGIPVATMALNGAKNAGLFSLRIIATNDKALSNKMDEYRISLKDIVIKKAKDLKKKRGE